MRHSKVKEFYSQMRKIYPGQSWWFPTLLVWQGDPTWDVFCKKRWRRLWGAFSFNGTMALQVVQGCQTVAGYVEMLQWASLLTEGSYLCGNDFQQDNTAVHNGHLTKDFQKNNVARLDYPAGSPNLNPIENVWGWMAVPDLGCLREAMFPPASWKHWHQACLNKIFVRSTRMVGLLSSEFFFDTFSSVFFVVWT